MPNGDLQPSGPELDALLRRSALLAAKVTSLEDRGFSRQEAMQILFADIEAGLTEFGTPTPASTGISVGAASPPPPPPPPPLDLSTLIGEWNITPAALEEECRWGGIPVFSLAATKVEISAIGQGKRYDFLFRDAGGNGTRAEGQLSAIGGLKFDFVGDFDQSGVRLRAEGASRNGNLDVIFTFQYKGTALDLPVPGFSSCEDNSTGRILVRA